MTKKLKFSVEKADKLFAEEAEFFKNQTIVANREAKQNCDSYAIDCTFNYSTRICTCTLPKVSQFLTLQKKPIIYSFNLIFIIL